MAGMVRDDTWTRSAAGLAGTIDRLDWSWNADDPFDTTCMTFRVTRPWETGNPVEPNCLVTAEGVTYGSVSQGYTDATGHVCLLVKKNAQVQVKAVSMVPNYQSVPVILTSPNFPAGANNCGDPVLCPAGSVACFTSVTFHRSGWNRTPRLRRTYLIQYAGEDIRRRDGSPWGRTERLIQGGQVIWGS